MSVRVIAIALLVAVAFLAGVLWTRQTAHAPSDAAPAPAPAAPAAGGPPRIGSGENPGVSWTVPGRWSREPDRAMRLATYSIPPAPGDGTGAECAVFYFGPRQGGGVDENIGRWVGQFE